MQCEKRRATCSMTRPSSKHSSRCKRPLAYLDAPGFRAYWDMDAKKKADVVQRIGTRKLQ